MSREVRRVPLDWKHPTEHNPYWVEQQYTIDFNTYQRVRRPASRLHAETERFIGLLDNYPSRLAEWEDELREMKAREGHGWTFAVEYHLTGYQGREDAEPVVHPWYGYTEDGMTETSTPVRDESHLYQLAVAQVESEKPDPADYMPVWSVPADELGWCLYQTVSEGAPVTPVFATAEELIEHLATVGQDWDQTPMRRAAAEALVRSGGSLGSFVTVGGTFYNSSDDADRVADALGGRS